MARRLAAIMFSDMVGYTASTQTDEARTLQLLQDQEELVRPFFAAHEGREIKSTGDGYLVEFDSALKATRCALDLQRRIHERNAEKGKIPFQVRIGIHLGDVEERGTDILGDAVNVAARIEPIAEPGGICMSGAVREQVWNKIPDKLEKLAPRLLKGLQEETEIYRVIFPWTGPISPFAAPSLAGLAVLPFTNISPDPGDEYFADGLTEEMITVLSHLRELRVIARTSVMQYRSSPKPASQIGTELGVSWILEGSVRKAGNRLRITAQLIDTRSQGHVWAATYDRELDDVFAVQSDIATRVAGSIPGNLPAAKAPVPLPKETPDIQAFMYFLQGQALVYRRDEESLKPALRFFGQAVERDPSFARAYAAIARCYISLCIANAVPFSEAAAQARTAVETARSINPDLPEAQEVLASLSYLLDDPLEVTEKELRKALELNPNLASAYVTLGLIDASKGDPTGWVSHCETAYQLDPLSPSTIRWLGAAYFYTGREQDALEHWNRTLHLDPLDSYRQMAAYYISKGDLEKADEMVKELERIGPTNPFAYLSRGYLAALKGDKTTAMEMIAKLNPVHEPGYIGSIYAGYIYLALGDVDTFFEHMFSAVKDHTLDDKDIMYSPLFAEVRKDPRTKKLLNSIGRRLPTKL